MEKPKRRPRSNGFVVAIVIILGIVVCVGFFVGIFAMVTTALKPVVAVGDGFLEALRDEDYQTAFDFLNPGLQSRIADADNLRAYLREYSVEPESWTYNNQEINNNSGYLGGTVTYKNGTHDALTIQLAYEVNGWQITYFVLGQRGSYDF